MKEIFYYKEYRVEVIPNGVCFTCLIYKGRHSSEFVGGTFAHQIAGDAQQIAIEKAMAKIDQKAA